MMYLCILAQARTFAYELVIGGLGWERFSSDRDLPSVCSYVPLMQHASRHTMNFFTGFLCLYMYLNQHWVCVRMNRAFG